MICRPRRWQTLPFFNSCCLPPSRDVIILVARLLYSYVMTALNAAEAVFLINEAKACFDGTREAALCPAPYSPGGKLLPQLPGSHLPCFSVQNFVFWES